MNKKIIVALDNNNIKNILNTINDLKEEAFAFKVGYEFFYNFGHEGYILINKKKIKIFLDLKLHDIPNTVKKGIEAISKLTPIFLLYIYQVEIRCTKLLTSQKKILKF